MSRLNKLFIADGLTDSDRINYALTARDELSESIAVMTQIANNNRGRAMFL